MASQSASLTTFTLCFSASFSLEPAPGPATTRSVLAETEPDTLEPSRSAMAFASLRVICSRLPVKTTVLPAKALAVPARSIGSVWTSFRSSCTAEALCGSAKNWISASVATGPISPSSAKTR